MQSGPEALPGGRRRTERWRSYDGDGNRISRTEAGATTRFLVDDLTPTGYAQVAEELVIGAVTTKYSYGLMRLAMNRGGTVSYYGYDPGGSVRQLASPAGAVTDSWTYDAFGNTIVRVGSAVNSFLYRGEQFDAALGLYYLRARYYSPQTGRFLTADQYEGEELGTCDCANRNKRMPPIGAHHLFAYANVDPVNNWDPSGRDIVSRSILFGEGSL